MWLYLQLTLFVRTADVRTMKAGSMLSESKAERFGEVDKINGVQEVLAVLKFSSLTFCAKAAVELMHPCLRRYAKFRARYTPAISLNSDSDSRTSDNFNHIDTHDKSPSTFARDSLTPLAYN